MPFALVLGFEELRLRRTHPGYRFGVLAQPMIDHRQVIPRLGAFGLSSQRMPEAGGGRLPVFFAIGEQTASVIGEHLVGAQGKRAFKGVFRRRDVPVFQAEVTERGMILGVRRQPLDGGSDLSLRRFKIPPTEGAQGGAISLIGLITGNAETLRESPHQFAIETVSPAGKGGESVTGWRGMRPSLALNLAGAAPLVRARDIGASQFIVPSLVVLVENRPDIAQAEEQRADVITDSANEGIGVR